MKKIFLAIAFAIAAVSCTFKEPTKAIDEFPDIFPDYIGVTIPQNIAPLNFRLNSSCEGCYATIQAGALSLQLRGPEFDIPIKKWRELLSAGDDLSISVVSLKDGEWTAWKPFCVSVSQDKIDPYLTYRLIEPGYETWNSMGIYQRCLEDFTQTEVITNTKTGENCMNCHSFPSRDADKIVFHMRGVNGGTYIADNGKVEKLNTKTPETISALVYPQWHPDGKMIAFSVNSTAQVFHSTNPNRVEVFDSASDVLVYDVEAHELHSTQLLMREDVLETYPTFTPDGKRIIFCSSPMPEKPQDIYDIRYRLCAIDFDKDSYSFGNNVDTLYNVGSSATFPRISPDGRFLMFTESEYGCFTIWHKDAQLRLLDLQSGELVPVDELNSDDVESYHSWSNNSRWVVFSSRRLDGLYTRPFIAHIDADGKASKPFLLPQKETGFYHDFFKSYNIPEFTDARVSTAQKDIIRCACEDSGVDITFKK